MTSVWTGEWAELYICLMTQSDLTGKINPCDTALVRKQQVVLKFDALCEDIMRCTVKPKLGGYSRFRPSLTETS